MAHGPGYFEDRAEPQKKLYVAADEEQDMPLAKRHALAEGGSSTTLNLPNVSEAEGFVMTVRQMGSGGVDIDPSDGTQQSIISLGSDGAEVVLRSDGERWIQLQ